MKKIFIVFLLLFPILFSNCSNPVSPDDVDPRLIGEWYYTYNNSLSFPSPDTSFYGIQINFDKNIKMIGIETNTGKVAVIKSSNKKVIKANEGRLIWEYILEGIGLSTVTYNYRIENEKLILSNGNQDFIYTKTSMGAQIFEPLTSNLSFKVDSIAYENNKIYSFPSAYVSKKSPSAFLLKANLDYIRLDIEINNFNGIGSYEIPFGKGIYNESSGDVVFIMLSDSLSSDNITIDQYDEVHNICSGTFSFNVIFPDYPDDYKKELREGIFTVPIYK